VRATITPPISKMARMIKAKNMATPRWRAASRNGKRRMEWVETGTETTNHQLITMSLRMGTTNSMTL
jgi:hypothetical protein